MIHIETSIKCLTFTSYGDKMNTLRLIRSNKTYADFSTNMSPAIERALEERISENTVVLNIFSQDSFTVGFLDDPE